MNDSTNHDAADESVAAAELAASRTATERLNPGPPPIQFRLKTLLLATLAIALVFASAGRIPSVWLAALVWFLLLASAHVAANAMGTRASALAPSRHRVGEDRPTTNESADPRTACAPTTRLGVMNSLGTATWIATIVGAVVGCVVGTVLVAMHNGGWRGWPVLVLSAVSSSGVGAFLSFLAASCAKVVRGAWNEAAGK